MTLDAIQKNILHEVADLDGIPQGAYNIRSNGASAGRNTTANIDIVTKEDKPGIDIIIKPGTKGESVHIPVVLTESGLKDMVYNDFYVGEGADVTAETRIPSTMVFTHFTWVKMPRLNTLKSTTAKVMVKALESLTLLLRYIRKRAVM